MLAIKKFFEKDSVRGPISSSELLAFKNACTKEEWEYYAIILGVCPMSNKRFFGAEDRLIRKLDEGKTPHCQQVKMTVKPTTFKLGDVAKIKS